MNWLAVLIGAFASVLLSPFTFAETADMVEIQSISHALLPEGQESITFQLSGRVVPKIFIIRDATPRLVIDFPESTYAGKSVLPLPESKLVTAIRTGLHRTPKQKVRVVVDFAKDIAVQHSLGEYVEADGTLTVTLVEDAAKQQQKARKEVKQAVEEGRKPAAELPSAEELAARPLYEKPVPPVLHRKETKEEPPVQDQAKSQEAPAQDGVKSPEPPQLIDITFDDNSKKGEMVLFHLDDFHPPTVSAVEKDTPRVFCDFMAMGLGAKVQKDISVKGKYVRRIHTTEHKKPDKVQVVLELAPDRDYDLQQVFFKNDNLFVLIVNELAPEDTGNRKQETGNRDNEVQETEQQDAPRP